MDEQRETFQREQQCQMDNFQQQVLQEQEQAQASLRNQQIQIRKLKQELEDKEREIEQRSTQNNEELGSLRTKFAAEKEKSQNLERRLRTVINQQSQVA